MITITCWLTPRESFAASAGVIGCSAERLALVAAVADAAAMMTTADVDAMTTNVEIAAVLESSLRTRYARRTRIVPPSVFAARPERPRSKRSPVFPPADRLAGQPTTVQP